MAKISARGATEVARQTAFFPLGGEQVKYTFVLRSDRMILKKVNGLTGYRAIGKVPSHLAETERVPFFERYVTRFTEARRDS